MNRNKLPVHFLICLILFPSYVASLTISDFMRGTKGCPIIEHQEDLSLSKFQGVWFASYLINPILSSDLPCQVFDVKLNGPETLIIDLNSRVMPGIITRARAKGKVVNSSAPAVMSWEWNLAPDMLETTIVAETDYENYAVMITCNPFATPTTRNLSQRQQLAGIILSRDQKIQDSFLNYGKQVLKKYFGNDIGWPMQTSTCNLNPISSNENIIELGSSQSNSTVFVWGKAPFQEIQRSF